MRGSRTGSVNGAAKAATRALYILTATATGGDPLSRSQPVAFTSAGKPVAHVAIPRKTKMARSIASKVASSRRPMLAPTDIGAADRTEQLDRCPGGLFDCSSLAAYCSGNQCFLGGWRTRHQRQR
jgi:hypothetical protein